MGLSIKCKTTGTAYYLGYGGMFQLRSKVAELFDKELGYLYKDAYSKIGDERKEALSAICHYANRHKPVSLKIWNFLWLSDTGAQITYVRKIRKEAEMTNKPLYRKRSGAYSTSKDYAHLKELLDKGLYVVAFINYDAGNKSYLFQDVCFASKKFGSYEFNSRGFCYLSIDPDLDYPFEEMCEADGVEYIEPNN